MRKHRFMLLLVLCLVTAVVYASFSLKLFDVADNGNRTVTVVLKTQNVRSDYWQTANMGAQTAAKELGVKLDLQGPLQETDADAQILALQDAIDRKPDAIVVAPIEDPRMPAVLEDITEAGIQLVVMDTPLPVKRMPAVVSSNHEQAGRLAGETIASLTKSKPVVAILSDSPDSLVSAKRYEGIGQALKPYADSVFGSYYCGDSEEKAYETALSLLQLNPEINAFITLNEATTLGAAKALKEMGASSAHKLIGFDSSIYEIQLLDEGTVSALVVQKPFNLGYLGVKTAMKLVNGSKSVRTTLIDSTVVTRDNMSLPENQKLLFPFTVIE
ncbi:periplasmic binding protein/LacI transcriptional regulator [Paenibacillus curdlanolyticus YK9]|uniref:Periplasmic binding protein/LacI transcriptional regulator n=1 Tax=Paenibacillus curdlanolyticus YK9 TaxID=717606 RepID=E0I8N8_9BACL|nr:substrate-binding domain-containing protein [Paenibacillus curdlanolyticus]EFM10772.1 periplasmic binding protein/LacI transcriptional regulator [Paenibacillus curdlanolyticus YK9]